MIKIDLLMVFSRIIQIWTGSDNGMDASPSEVFKMMADGSKVDVIARKVPKLLWDSHCPWNMWVNEASIGVVISDGLPKLFSSQVMVKKVLSKLKVFQS